MRIKAIPEEAAAGEVKQTYQSLKEALEIRSVPVFFTYIAAFPDYLTYISHQVLDNLKSQQFVSLSTETSSQIESLILESLDSSEERTQWLSSYKMSPNYVHFISDLDAIHRANIKLALLFIAIRESVKGWAVAAKKLPDSFNRPVQDPSVSAVSINRFVFDDIVQAVQPDGVGGEISHQETGNSLRVSSTAITYGGTNALEKNMLPTYLKICQTDFANLMKTERFWIVRVGIERMLLSSIDLFPHLIFSPINVFYRLTQKYPDFPDLLYLPSEHFPTYAVQRMMFSSYLLKQE